MLTIRSINPTGMFSYGRVGTVDVERRGLVNLRGVNDDKGGDSNGSGKSSLFNALCEILFGENPTGVSGNDVINQVMDSGYAGRVEFISWEGVHYRVTYCRGWKEDYYPVDNDNKTAYRGANPTLFFDKFDGEKWCDGRGSKMAETRGLIIDALGITYSRFLSIAYLSHRVGSTFLRGTNKERMDIMAGITGVEEWDRILVNARGRKLSIQQEVSAAQQKIAYEEGSLTQIQARLDIVNHVDWRANITQYSSELTNLGTKVTQVESRLAELATEMQQLTEDQAAAYDQTGSGALSQEISNLSVEEQALRAPGFIDESLPQFDQVHVQNVQNKKNEISSTEGALRMYTRGGSDFRDMDKCPTCHQPISEETKKGVHDAVDHLENELDTLRRALQQLEVTQKIEEAKVRDAREERYRERLQDADALAAQVEEKRALLRQSSLEYERLTGEVQRVTSAQQELVAEKSDAEAKVVGLQHQIKGAEDSLQELESLQLSIKEKRELVGKMQSEIAGDVEDTTILEWLISNIPYIKLHRMSVAMKQLSEKVNSYLAEMGDTIRVNISSFEAKKSTKGAGDIKDALKSDVRVEVVDGTKNIDPRLYSDGEVSKISNALIRALHDVATQTGHGCNLILLDEIFSFVDLNNSERLAESFKDVVAGTTLVTDNSGYVNDLMEFNEVWVARKRGGMTTLEVA